MSNTVEQYSLEIESEKYQAEIYIDTYYTKLLAYEGYKQEVMKSMADLPVSSSILDVGCGTGWFLSMLRDRKWHRLAGLDISPDMLEIANAIVPEAILHEAPIQEYAESAEGGYEVITCLGTLHHMPDLDRVAQSLYMLLKPGGVMIVHEPNEEWFYEHSTLLRGVMRTLYAPLRIKNNRRVHDLRQPWKQVPPSPHHEDVAIDYLLDVLQKSGFVVETLQFKNTLMRVFEGMLFRDSSFDRWLYRTVRWLDENIFDRFAGKSAGATLLRLRKHV